MAFKDQLGTTDIKKGKLDNLSLNWDSDDDPSDIRQRYPVLLYTPNMNDLNTHYHIAFTDREAKVLRDWLTSFLKMKTKKRSKRKATKPKRASRP